MSKSELSANIDNPQLHNVFSFGPKIERNSMSANELPLYNNMSFNPTTNGEQLEQSEVQQD